MTLLATILLLAATINAQFAGDAAAGSKPRDIATRPTNWLAQANKQASTKPKRKSWKRVKHIPVTDPRNPFYVDPNAPKSAMSSTARAPPPGAECRQYSWIEDVSADMVSLLLNAKANVHCKARDGREIAPPEGITYPEGTPLGITLLAFFPDEESLPEPLPAILRIATMLLRAGASLDAVSDDRTAEVELRAAETMNPALRDNDIFVQTKALIDGVRAAGSWKLYCRQDHKKILRLRSLVARGRATPKKWSPRGHDRRAIEFIVKIGDNGIAWKILSFWKET